MIIPVGIHLLVNVYSIPDPEIMKWLPIGKPLLQQIINETQLHVVSEVGHQFQPFGYSYAYVLSESHFTIHTYPEFSSCFIDIFCCNPAFNTEQAVEVIKKVYQTEQIRFEVVKR